MQPAVALHAEEPPAIAGEALATMGGAGGGRAGPPLALPWQPRAAPRRRRGCTHAEVRAFLEAVIASDPSLPYRDSTARLRRRDRRD